MKYSIPVSMKEEKATMLSKYLSLQSRLQEWCIFIYFFLFFGMCSKCLNSACGEKKKPNKTTTPQEKHN